MDQVVSSALGEICLQGANGLAVSSLWPKLVPILTSSNLDLSPSVKTSIWVNLLKVPAIQFEARDGAVSPTDPSIQRAEDAEKVNLKVVAKQSLRDNFIGLYDAQSAVANISARQRETLERLAVARESGVTQSQLGKEFGIDGKDVFYIVKNLESRGLIVRQSATLRRREACGEGESKNSLSVTTNNLYLYRYAKPLGSQQKLEITSEERADNTGSAIESLMAGESLPDDLVKEDVIVKDYLPAMRAVYDMLEAAENKVLVVADIKQNLGYRGGPLSHKAWRTVCNRLKDAGIVEEFDAKVNEKVQSCLRLLKKFPIGMSESNISGCGDNDANSQAAKFGRTHRMSQQVVELPIEHQAFDMITAEGAKGLTLKEVCERLGLNNKRNHIRLVNMCSRFGMHLAADNNRKGMIYRAWAPGFFNPDASGASQIKSGNLDSGNKMSNQDPDNPPPSSLQCLPSVSGRELTTARKIGKRETVAALPCRSVDGNGGNIQTDLVTQEEESCEPRSPVVVDAELALVISTEEKGVVLSEMSPDKTSNKSVIDKRYPRLSLTPDCIRREQRILERVQKEKFILRAELYKWLVSLEKDKCTTMDRKTIDRIVNKLQKEGQCKCVHINIPSVTNCSRGRISQVILHPSIKDISPFLNEIHERVRAFEISSRGHSSSRLKNLESIPVLEGIQRIPNPVSDAVSGKSEAMRANGFVLAKMVRTKLLHCFLWDYVQSSLNSSSDFLSNYRVRDIDNPHSSYSLFSLDEAIKAIPLELFLQVAGSTQTFDDMVQKCKNGLRLSDLPLQEYRILMDTLATGRLSKLIDILRRLKLIRLVNNGETGDGTQVTHATVTHSLELKPYIEEPLSIVTKSFNFVSHDLRPRIRHDFILSNKEAVDEYWQTLEYCYAATDPKAAVHSFPGSSVHEVFFFRSWASARVMTAEQREELLKRVTRDNINEKLSYKECEKIANDLNLTLEQVLRVYYDRRNKCLNKFEKAKRKAAEGPKPTTRADASRKRKRSVKLPPKRSNEDAVSRFSNNENNVGLSEWADNCRKDPANSVDSAEAHDEEDPVSFVKPGQNTQSEGESSKKMKPKRQQRSPWTEETDRQVLMQYVRHRAARGAKCQRADWSLISDLPAKPKACAKRVASLKKNKVFRKALMRLCNILSERYVKHLQKMQRKSQKSGSGAFVGSSTKWNDASDLFSEAENSQLTGLEKEQWDDFNCKSIKTVLEEVLRFKRMSRLEALRADQSDPENMDYQDSPGSPTSPSQDTGGAQGCGNPYSQRRTRRHLHKKLTNLFVGGIHVNRHIKDSLAVSNAVELFKLIFLNTSTAPEVPNLLAASLRRYSEHDLFAAFSYLRERKIMMGGNTSQQYELSQTFIHNISKSMFPAHTGRRISLFSSWLRGREKDLNEGEVVLADDLQCGDVVQLFGLVSSGELSISPRLPEDGVGEAEDWRNMKRGANDDDVPSNNNKKKLKSVLESEVAPRREKGFPGIQLSVRRETFLRARAVELMKDSQHNSAVDHIESTSTLSADTSAVDQAKFAAIPADYMKELLSSADKSSTTINTVIGMNWESISCYAENMMPVPSEANCKSFFCPEVFKTVFAAIQRAGDQGLSMEEVSEIAGSPGEEILELFIEVLHSFGLVVKVNGFDAVRIVDALFRSKYLLTSFTGPSHHQSIIVHHSPAKSLEAAGLTRKPENNNDQNQRETHTAVNSDQMHRVTILNLPEETDLPITTDAETSCVHGSSVLGNTVQACSGTEGETYGVSSNAFCMPIVPWINGDGTINKVVYRGLVRRVLGVVMLNPGILEENIIQRMDVLNPQGCRRLLELLVLDKHLIVRKMQESTRCGPPSMLRAPLGGSSSSSSSNSSRSSTYREHFFANPMSGHLL